MGGLIRPAGGVEIVNFEHLLAHHDHDGGHQGANKDPPGPKGVNSQDDAGGGGPARQGDRFLENQAVKGAGHQPVKKKYQQASPH